jgi:GNAT superfamily N-acetyltransferase
MITNKTNMPLRGTNKVGNVISEKAGIQNDDRELDSRFHKNDGNLETFSDVTSLDKLSPIKSFFFSRHIVFVLKEMRRRFYSDDYFYALRCELKDSKETSHNKSIRLRNLKENDIPKLLNLNSPDISYRELKDRLIRLLMIKADIQQCLVAVNSTDDPCHMLWVIKSSENTKVQAFFKRGFPILTDDEVLLEGLFTREEYRNKGIMRDVLSKIIEMGEELKARWAIAFVRKSNISSLKGFQRAGFVPYMLRHDRRRMFFRKSTYTELNMGTFSTND